MPSTTDPSDTSTQYADLDVRGNVPSGLSGQLVGVDDDGVIHSVQVGGGRVSYHSRQARIDAAVHHLVAFGGSLLAFGADCPAYELTLDEGTLRRVDLAGRSRSLAPCSTHDPVTGDLHVLACDTDGRQAHVVISAGALTRHSRAFHDPPGRVRGLALGRDHVAFVADGFVGAAPREGELRPTWIPTGITAAHLAHAHGEEDAVVVLVLTPMVEQWTLDLRAARIRREVLDPTPRRATHLVRRLDGQAPRQFWTTGDGTIGHHDLAAGHHTHHRLEAGDTSDLFLAVDPDDGGDQDGWLVGFVHAPAGRATAFCVIPVTDGVARATTTAAIPRSVPRGIRCTWIPSSRR